MPHITEELWASLGFAESNGGLPLMRTPLPSAENLLAGLDESRITLAIPRPQPFMKRPTRPAT